MSKPFGLKDADYWIDPWKNLAAVSWDRVDKDVVGILLDAPDQVPLDTHDTLPVLAYHSDTTLSLWQASFREHGIVAAIRLEDDAFFAEKALPPVSADLPKAPEPSPGFAGLEYDLDLRETLALPWIPSTLWVSAFLRDTVSNHIKVVLGPSPSAYSDPAVEKFLEDERAKLPQRSPAFPREVSLDPVTVPFQSKSGDKAGFAFTAHRVMVADRGASGKLHVSWRLNVRSTDVSKDGPKSLIKGLPPVTAIAAMSLLLIGSQRGELIPISLRLPSFDPVQQENDRIVATGSFALDLLKYDIFREEPQTWFIYGFAGDILQGPATVAVVAPNSLPQGGH